MIKKSNYTKGKVGEQIAEDHLTKLGYQILERNTRSPFGEIDLIAKHEGYLVFIEVKSRQDSAFGFPEESVNQFKKQKLYKLASWYLTRFQKTPKTRFDVLAIENAENNPNFRLIQNAIEF